MLASSEPAENIPIKLDVAPGGLGSKSAYSQKCPAHNITWPHKSSSLLTRIEVEEFNSIEDTKMEKSIHIHIA